jgi:DivIVA domain-containing protein
MIDLTPLDVRKKRGDFVKGFRGYDTQQVDAFLELAAERLEELVKENLTLAERVERLGEQVAAHAGREQAVNDALVTAQQLREDIANSANREAEVLRREALADADRMRSEAESDAARARMTAESEADRIVSSAERRVEELRTVLAELERRRARFLASFRTLLERELDNVEVQEGRTVDEDVPVELDLGPRPLPPVVDMFASSDPDSEADADAGADGDTSPEGGEPAAAEDRTDVDAAVPADIVTRDELTAAVGLDEDEIDHEFVPSSFETVEAAEVLASTMERIEQTPLGVFDPAPPVPLPGEQSEEDSGGPSEADAATDVGADADAEFEVDADADVEPGADVHRLAADTRLAADPPPSGTDWLEVEENDRR